MDNEIKSQDHDRDCPECGTKMQTLLFMGVIPEGYVCPECKLWFNDECQLLAKVF